MRPATRSNACVRQDLTQINIIMEFQPKIEKEPVKIYDILNLSPEEVRHLRSRIEKWAGLVRIFVHPMYEKWMHSQEIYLNHTNGKELEKIENFLAKLLAMPEEKTPPIIIMEETKYITALQNWLKTNPQGASQDKVFLVKTRPDNFRPDLENKNEKESWKILIDKLTDLGVKKILMGGMYFATNEFERDWTKRGPGMSYCVGIAMSHLSKDKAGKFEVELSALTSPRNERDYFNFLKRRMNKGR